MMVTAKNQLVFPNHECETMSLALRSHVLEARCRELVAKLPLRVASSALGSKESDVQGGRTPA